MDHYMKIASEYLEEFEGWSLYPGWKNPYVWGGILLGIGWIVSIVSVVMSIGQPFSYLLMGVAGVVVFEIFGLIALEKVRRIKDVTTLRVATEKYHRPFEAIGECRIHALSQRLGVEQSKFFTVAKECKELLELQRAFRTPANTDLAFYVRKIYDPESKARLMAIVMAAISFIAALTVRSIPGELDIFNLLSDQSFHTGMLFILFFTAFAYFVWTGMLVIGWMLFEGIVMLIVKSGVDKGKSRTALRYLTRDLIRFHKLEKSNAVAPLKKPYRLLKSRNLSQ